jgi:hypothetical protein
MIKINYKKKNKYFYIKIKNKLLFIFYIKKINNNNISILSYNYYLLLKILRNFGLLNPIYNKKNYKIK